MRYFPLMSIACLLCWLAPASIRAQQLQSNPCDHSFGKVQVGSSKSFSFQLTNVGSKTLQITSASEQGSAFSLGNFPVPVTLQPAASVVLPVIFTPTASGWKSGTITLASNDPHSPLYLHVAGTGVPSSAPVLNLTPATLNFGNVTVGSSASLQVTLSASNAAVTISSDGTNSSEFAIVGLTLPATISVGQNVPVTIQFTPNASGTATAQGGFTSNAVDSPAIEQLTGTGVAPQSHSVNLSWEPGSGSPVGYNVYRGTAQGGPYQMINSSLDASTNYTDSTVASGATYFYAVTEVNAQDQESGYSNVAEAVIPSP